MKIVFFGSSEFAVPIFEALNDKEEVILVVTQPDRKKGRSLKLTATPVKNTADKLGINVFQPLNVNSGDAISYLKGFDMDIFVVVSFGEILSNQALSLPKLYPLNVHTSLLPKYRGAAPINWAIANGEEKTGVTVIRMNGRMDEGDIVLAKAVPISASDDAVTVSEKLSKEAVLLLLNAVDLIKMGKAVFVKQNNNEASYAPKLQKKNGLIDWAMRPVDICNRIRAFMPWPGCFTYWRKKMLKVCRAVSSDKVVPDSIKPGTVIEAAKDGISVNSGKGALIIQELHLEGGRRMNAEEFISGHRDMKPGEVFLSRD